MNTFPSSEPVRTGTAEPADASRRDGTLVRVRLLGAPPRFGEPVADRQLAGVVESVGLAVTEFAPGDEVIGLGGPTPAADLPLSGRVTAPARLLARKPASLTWGQALQLSRVGPAAYQGLVSVLGVLAGETVLVHAAAGPMGSVAVQIAVSRGARVIGAAGRSNHDYLTSLGAEPVAEGEGLADRVRALAPDGVDAVFDPGGGDGASRSHGLVKDAGRTLLVVDRDHRRPGARFVPLRHDRAGLVQLARLADQGALMASLSPVLSLRQAAEACRLSTAVLPFGTPAFEVG